MAKELFEEFFKKHNLNINILETEEKTHTAQQAAYTHSVPIQNIVKSILVKIDKDFCLFLVPGNKQLDLEKKKKEFKTQKVRIANAQEVKNITGYSIGGVPPFGHKEKLRTFVEKGFNEKEKLLAAAGSPNAVFKIELEELEKIV